VTTITIIHEHRLSSDSMLFLRELAAEIARRAAPTGTVSEAARGAAGSAEGFGPTGPAASNQSSPEDARTAGDEQSAFLDVFSQTRAGATSPAPFCEGRGGRYTEAQMELIKRRYDEGAAAAVVWGEVCKVPGLRPTLDSFHVSLTHWRKKGILSPVRNMAGRRAASHEYILQWANARGLCMDGKLDLQAVNEKARALGLPDWVQKTKD
jgi:hypothetical protein